MIKNSPICLCILLLCLCQSVLADFKPTAPGYGQLDYSIPQPGSYHLPSLGDAADGQVINQRGDELSLHKVFDGKYVLMAFMYSRCDDVNGCPLSSYVFYQIKSAMEQESELAEKLKLVSLSFDPEYDTAEVLAGYANNFRYNNNRGEWVFLSTTSESALTPILKAYSQDIQREVSLNNDEARYAHLLRVFLIDPQRKIRNIYSVEFLHANLLINDIKTLLLQETGDQQHLSASTKFGIISPGYDRYKYNSTDYRTRSLAITQRQGNSMDLLALIQQPPLGLPAVPQPDNNVATRERIQLGRKLFFDRRLSLNDTFSCAMCHVPEQGFSSNELQTAVGIEGRSVRRNSPTLYNSAYAEILFHDGREYSLEQQVWGPLLARNEMGNPSIGYVVKKIQTLADYRGLFEQAYAGRGVTMETLGMALAAYQRSLLSADSPFDRWYYAMQTDAMSDSAIRGFRLFTGKAGCNSCHSVTRQNALFTDQLLHNTGIGYRESMGIRPEKQRVQLAPGVFVDVDTRVIESVGEAAPADLGQYEVTENPDDRWKYKTPGLRNIALTAPYMHNGSLGSLTEVIEFYTAGGIANPLLDKRIRSLHLTELDKQDLVAFLQSLTGSNVEALVADAFAAPVGDVIADQSERQP